MGDLELRTAVRAALAAAWGPAVSVETLERATEVTLRRWQSFTRRAPRHATRDGGIEDVAKALRDAFEPDRRLVGPMMDEYRALARAAAAVLDPVQP